MKVLRFLLGLAFGTAGVLHFTRERQFRNIVPDYLPLQNCRIGNRGHRNLLVSCCLLKGQHHG